MKIQEFNVESQEVVVRDATAEEIINAKKTQQELDDLRQEMINRKSAAVSKLQALGLTVEDLQSLGL